MTEGPDRRCLICCRGLSEGDSHEYHARCSRALFGRSQPPEISHTMRDVEDLARQEISQRLAITGVQPKISVDLRPASEGRAPRLTFVGLWGRFILKPPAASFPEMVELEHATMRLAAKAGIETASHGLVRLASGELAFVSRRFDRWRDGKLALEDMCQLTGKLTEDKYRSSMERVGKAILRWSSNPGLEVTRFFDVAVFSFLTGNADMHLKNFSLLTELDGTVRLAPAYDLLPTRLILPEDPEEMALTLNGKRARIGRQDLLALGKVLKMPHQAMEASFRRFRRALPSFERTVSLSFLGPEKKQALVELIAERWRRLDSRGSRSGPVTP
jgi:serine/threonine-protein kinase HipA